MNSKYHTGVYINDNKFTDVFFDNTFKIVDPFNKWRNDCNIPQILSDSKYGTVEKTYFDFKLKIAYNSSSDGNINEPLTRLGKGFIKGNGIGTLIPKFADIVYEDVVKRKSEWVFVDLHTVNFIVEKCTKKIYAIDFQSYARVPDHATRQALWESCTNSDLNDLKTVCQCCKSW